jgi:Zn-dependent peptidase ImmA (M78 family)
MKILKRPILSAEQIEQKASVLLTHFHKQYFDYIKPTPLLDITRFLSEKYSITFIFDNTLGFSEDGARVLGACNIRKRVLLVDSSLKNDEHKFNYTLAHELGHLALHRNLKIQLDSTNNPNEPKDTVKESGYETSNLNTEADWVEWQANQYASCLLMPKTIMKAALILKQRELGISRTGKIFVDNQSCNQVDYFEIISRLSVFFKVSRTAVEYRLNKLNLVDDRRRGFRSISDILSS